MNGVAASLQSASYAHILILEALQLALLVEMIRGVAGGSQDVFSAILNDLAGERVGRRRLGLRIAGRLCLLIGLLARLRNRGISRRQGLRRRLRFLQALPGYQLARLKCVFRRLWVRGGLLGERTRRDGKEERDD